MNPMTDSNSIMSSVHDDAHAVEELLPRLDLNLVVAFDVLMRERSVTRAAARLGVTQSAVSHALRRLRELLGDPLMVRSGQGMVLTPRAEALAVPLRSGLLTLGRALAQPATFEPSSARRTFTLALIDLFDLLVLPQLLRRVRREAPGVDLSVVSAADRLLSQRLETGEIDLALTVQTHVADEPIAATGPGLLQTTLFRDGLVCLVRANHPALLAPRSRARRKAASLSLETYVALSHVLVSPRGRGPGMVDEALVQRGLKRRIALRVPNFYSALAIVAESDLVLTAPAPLASLASPSKVVTLPTPIPLPEHSVNLVWHERFGHEPGLRWLRERTIEAARASQARMQRRA
jgi:DNA-binding transcriptional LysR family regulator